MNRFLLILLSLALYSSAYCQLPNGSPAPDIDVVDINGNGYNMYSMMGANKSACLDFSATWCGPCWSFHQSGVLEAVYNNLSAYTTVLFVEGDFATNTACLYGPAGCNNSTQGNWVVGSPYQITDLTSSNGPSVDNDYSISYYPTLYVISPDKRTWEIKERSYQNYVNWITKSFTLAATANLTNSACGDNGKIVLNATGGYGTLTYKWSNGATTKDLNNLPGGSYSVTVSDANIYFKEYGPFVITGPTKRVDITSVNLTHIKCYNEATGSIAVTVDYGTAPYSYNWSNGNKTNIDENIKAGSYSVTVTDFNNCTRVKSYTLNQPTDVTLATTSTKDNCNKLDGTLTAKALGGVAPYDYDLGFGQQQTPNFTDLKGGKYYTLTVTDANGCSETSKSYVDVSNKPKVEAGSDAPLDCKREIINLDGTQSDQGTHYSYLWTTKDGNIVKGAETLLPDVDKPGKYNLKVTDTDSKCIDVDSAYVLDKRVFPNIQATGDTILNCSLTQTEAKGTSNYLPTKFYWKKVNDSIFYKTGKSIVVSDSGKYIFHVKDTINLCISRDTVEIRSNQQKPVAVAKSDKDVSCKNTEVAIDGSGSSQGSNFHYTWTSTNGNIVSGGNTLTPIVNKGGDYALDIQDTVNYCTNNTNVNVKEQTQPSADFDKSVNGLTAQFNDQSSGIPTAWNWTFGDGSTSNEKNPQHIYSTVGEYDVCLTIDNDCGQNIKCQKLLIGSSVTLNCPVNVNQTACQSQSSIDTKFANWLTTATFTGGCDATMSNNNNGAPNACGASKTVTFTVTSTCDPTVTCSATFAINSSPAVVLMAPAKVTEAACQTQAAINSKFANWLATGTFTGGCDAVISNNNTGSPSSCGGSTTVTFTVTSVCEPNKTAAATFTVVNSPTVILTCAANQTEETGQTQTEINAKFASWLTTSTFTGGCNATISNNDAGGAPPNTGGFTNVTFTVTSSCDVPKTCSATFTVKDLVATTNPDVVKRFELTPNPVSGNGLINLQLDHSRNYKLSMVNVFGEVVWSMNSNTSKASIPIDLTTYSKGLYFVVLNTENSQRALKWVVD